MHASQERNLQTRPAAAQRSDVKKLLNGSSGRSETVRDFRTSAGGAASEGPSEVASPLTLLQTNADNRAAILAIIDRLPAKNHEFVPENNPFAPCITLLSHPPGWWRSISAKPAAKLSNLSAFNVASGFTLV
jgi:hypothetical protein